MLVSIIIPVYNTEAFLRECLDSVLAQTYRDIEVIAVDDGSTDSSGSILDEYAAADSRLRVIHQDNAGVSQARNVGMEAATGEWIMFVDSDDTVSPDITEAMLEVTKDFPEVALVCSSYTYGAIAPLRKRTRPFSLTSSEALIVMLRQTEKRNNNSGPWAKLFQRSAISECRFMPGIKYEDLEWMTRIYLLPKVKVVGFLPESLYRYRQHNAAFTGHFSPSRLDALRVTELIEKRCENLPEPIRLAARDRRFSAAFNVFNLLAKSSEGQYNEKIAECYKLIRERRNEVLRSPKARLKNRIGAAVSYLGQHVMLALARLS